MKMNLKKTGVRKNPKDNIFVPGISNVRNSLSLIRQKSRVCDEKETWESDLPSTFNSLNVAQTSMESLCQIGDEGLDSRDESTYSSIEETRDTSFKSPRLFGLDDSTSALPRDFVEIHPIKRKLAVYGMSATGSGQIKNSTMNQSAIEAGTMAIENVSPIKDYKDRGRKGVSTSWPFPDECQTFQDSSMETVTRDKIPAHINNFMRKFQNASEHQHDDALTSELNDDGEVSQVCWSSVRSNDVRPLCEWPSPKRTSKKKLRTYARKDRRSPFEKCPDRVAELRGESVRTSSPTVSMIDTTFSKNINLSLQFSSILECREDSEVPLGREEMKKNTVNSEEIVADSRDFPTGDSPRKVDTGVDEVPEVDDNATVSTDTDTRSHEETRPSRSSADVRVDAVKKAIPVVIENPMDSVDEESHPEGQTTEAPNLLSAVPLDEIGLEILKSPRRIMVHHYAPSRSTDSIHSVPPDEFAEGFDIGPVKKRRK